MAEAAGSGPPDGPPDRPSGTAEPVATPPSTRTRVRRHADRAHYERDTVEAILDEALIAHVGIATPDGPIVLPMAYGRIGDQLYLHGAAGNHLLRTAADAEVCVAVTLIDGLVFAKNAFSHSMNYRSVVIRGTGRLVTDPAEVAAGFDAVVDHNAPGRSAQARAADAAEVKATRLLAVAITEASCKVRAEGATSPEGDAHLPIWSGVVPIRTLAGAPAPEAGDAHHPAPPVRLPTAPSPPA